MTIEGDSREYDLLSSWAARTAKEFSKNKEEIMLTAEIGVRKGLATKLIMNYIRPNYSGLHFHIGIDPYGDLMYPHYVNSKPTKMDYNEKMFAEVKKDFAEEPRFNLLNMPDDIFFEKYYYGVMDNDTNSSKSATQFYVSWGHINGSGSNTSNAFCK